jgi:hypothetical protein
MNGASNNTALGYLAGSAVTTGNNNTFVGTNSGVACTDGERNTGIGKSAMESLQGGDYNASLGYDAGASITSGQNNVLIGYQAGTSSSPVTVATENNQACIGNDSIANSFIKVDWTVGSDIRDKTDIETLPDAAGLNFVNQMRPVTYKWDNRSNYYSVGHEKYGERDHSKKLEQNEVGFIAQEVKEIEKSIGWEVDHIVNTSDENKYKLMYSQVTPILVKAIQELSAKVEALENAQ